MNGGCTDPAMENFCYQTELTRESTVPYTWLILETNGYKVFTPDGKYVSEFGSSGTQDDKFLNPVGISVDNGTVYVTDAGNNAVKKFKTDGTFVKNYDSSIRSLLIPIRLEYKAI